MPRAFTYRRATSQEDKYNIQKENGLEYTVVKKLLEIGVYFNKGYHVFINTNFMSVPLVRHPHQRRTYITGTVRRTRKHLLQQFKNKFAVGQRMYCRYGPLLAYVLLEKSQRKSHHSSLQPCHSPRRGRHGGNRQIK
jgi:hypothetical protein